MTEIIEIPETPIANDKAIIVRNRKELPESAIKDEYDSNEYYETWVCPNGIKYYFRYPENMVRSRWRKKQSKKS